MSRHGLAALTSQYNDSDIEENESDEEEFTGFTEPQQLREKLKQGLALMDGKIPSASNSPASLFGSATVESLNHPEVPTPLRSVEGSDSLIDVDYEERPLSPISFHETLQNMKPEEIKIPNEPSGACSDSLLQKITRLHSLMQEKGTDMVASIQKRKDFRNPSIYEKLISYCNIDEFGSNFPTEVYDPHGFSLESYYEELAKRQKEEMDKKEKERKERTKVEFVTGTAKKPAIDQGNQDKKKSKWDVAGSSVGTLISGTSISNQAKSNLASIINKLNKEKQGTS